MKIIIAMDSMKGSLSSKQANQIVAEVFNDEQTEVKQIAIADGGEGTVEAFVANGNGTVIEANCRNLLGEEIVAHYGWFAEEKMAVIESALTCGIQFLDGTEKARPRNTNSFGLGEQILSASQRGAKRIIVGLGGTGTIDGGIGMLSCLGVQFFDSNNQSVFPIPSNFRKITRICTKKVLPSLKEIEFIIAADVKSIITGKKGAVYMFGKQKGLQVNELTDFENGMVHYSQFLLAGGSSQAGDGAAGGIALALRTILAAKVVPGLELIAQYTNLPKFIKGANLIITGEGKMDGQSLQGKVPVGIGAMAKKYHVPVIAFVGAVTGDVLAFEKAGLSVIIPIVNKVSTLEAAIMNAEQNLRSAAMRTKQILLLFNSESSS